jgi:hypothetical protein
MQDLGGFSAEREGVDSLQLRGVPSTQRLPTTDAVASLAVKSLVQTVAETSFQNAAKSIAGDTTLLAASGPAPMTDQIVQVQQTGQSAALTKQCAAPVLDTQHYWLSTGQTQQLPPLLASRDDGALPHAIKQPKAAPSALSLLHRCQTATASSAPLPQVVFQHTCSVCVCDCYDIIFCTMRSPEVNRSSLCQLSSNFAPCCMTRRQ